MVGMATFSTSGNDAQHPGYLVLLRHGQTAWSVSGQHTGRTDIPLTAVGQGQAVAAGARIRREFPEGFAEGRVFSSPLRRARQTAQYAGFSGAATCPGIAEWDYGRAEGRTRTQISEAWQGDWDLWRDGTQVLGHEYEGEHDELLPSGETVRVRNTAGEALDEVAARARGVVEDVLPVIEGGESVLLVAHAHILRILTTQWLGLDPHVAKLLRLDTAHFSVLSLYKGDRVIDHWNV